MNTPQYVSRAGEKLEHAFKEFNLHVERKIVADFGSSTGGFVDCLLKHGVAKVYSVDTAYGELAWSLRKDSRVVVLERTNAMHVTLPEKMELITNDTSWTRQKNVIPNIINNLKPGGEIITLIKPHYEAEKRLLHKGKLDESVAQIVAKEVLQEIQSMGLKVKGFTRSPIVGGKGGNFEYLAYLSYHDQTKTD